MNDKTKVKNDTVLTAKGVKTIGEILAKPQFIALGNIETLQNSLDFDEIVKPNGTIKRLKKQIPLYSWIMYAGIKGFTLSEKVILSVIVDKMIRTPDHTYRDLNAYIIETTMFPESTVMQCLTNICDKHNLLDREKESIKSVGKRHIYRASEKLLPYVQPLFDEEDAKKAERKEKAEKKKLSNADD